MSHRILDFYASKAWAMPEANLQEMYEIYRTALERKELGAYLDPEAVLAKTGKPLDNTRNVTVRDGVAVIPISGPIFRKANLFTEISGATSIEVLAKDIQQARDDRAVRAIVLEINSPGGEADGTSELAQLLYEMRGEKPLVAYVAHLGASAAYWLASAADEIVANDAASLGSIGVVASVCIHKDKNHLEFVSSQSPNKRPNPQTEAGRGQIQEWLDSLGDVFINTVARNRGMTAEQVIENGGRGGLRVGQKAVEAGLADRLGTLEGVIADLGSSDLAMWKPKRKNLKAEVVLDNSAKSDKGDLDMADEKPPVADSKPAVDNAALDKSIGERVAAFFQEKFGAKADTEPPAKTDERVDAHGAELERLRTETERANREASDAKAQVTALQKQARTTRYETLAKDWAGEKADHVSILEHLAASEGGEDSELFKGYVKQQNAVAEQLRVGGLFKELGATGAEAATAYDEIQTKAKAAVEASGGKLTLEQATSEVTAKDPALYKRYLAEQRSGAVAA